MLVEVCGYMLICGYLRGTDVPKIDYSGSPQQVQDLVQAAVVNLRGDLSSTGGTAYGAGELKRRNNGVIRVRSGSRDLKVHDHPPGGDILLQSALIRHGDILVPGPVTVVGTIRISACATPIESDLSG
jgi:hypothetical protein